MLDRWAPWYQGEPDVIRNYGPAESYTLAARFLSGLAVEDWGCGQGAFRQYHDGPYVGVDGTLAQGGCDVQADLTEYRSQTEGLLMRHVLEHNHEWERVLANAVLSYTRRMVIVLFMPTDHVTRVVHEDVAGLGVPDIAFRLEDVLQPIIHSDPEPAEVSYVVLDSLETMIYAERA